MKAISKSLLILCALLSFSNFLTACHTVQGAGEDVQSGGRAITRAAS